MTTTARLTGDLIDGSDGGDLYYEDVPDVHLSMGGEARCNGDEYAGATATCSACGERLDDGGAALDSGQAFDRSKCPDNPLDDDGEEYGPHDPTPVPLSWVNSASIRADENRDTLTVTISVGDPRGAFAMTVERVTWTQPDGTPRDELRLSVPSAGESLPHMDLEPLASPGYFRIVGGL